MFQEGIERLDEVVTGRRNDKNRPINFFFSNFRHKYFPIAPSIPPERTSLVVRFALDRIEIDSLCSFYSDLNCIDARGD